MGLSDFIETYLAIESDKAKQSFLSRRSKKSIDHLFASVDALYQTKQCCVFHTGQGQEECVVVPFKFDFVTLGPPCTPYTRRGGKAAAAAPTHPKFNVLWGATLEWLSDPERSPRGGWLEEVAGFDHKINGEDPRAVFSYEGSALS